MTDRSVYRAAVIGLGSIGLGIARSLLAAGFEVGGVDVADERRRLFEDAGGRAAADAASAAAGADCVLCVVVNAEQTEAVLFGDGGVAAAMPEGSVFVSCATMAPAIAESLGERLRQSGRWLLDAPTSGGAGKADSGELTLMSSGSAAAYAKAQPALDAIASKVYRLGDAPGMGSKVKMINQLLAGVHIAAACEAMSLGIKAGIDADALYDVICASAGSSWMFQNRVPHILEGDYSPRSAVDIFVKDLGIVLDAGAAADFPLPIASAAHALYREASDAGLGREDDAALAKLYARKANITLPAKK